ncbi:LacI family DNA-binding transcriptional regulator [Agromyces albus]|uniref:LacI family DNA-binding transcriptional regulator n=1 Tax=Agromyces albus TaxID=205332 RepID=UPI0027866F42|nr:LacI family DNA-binding transcriptional regulator [Agromyces albus]MDQ0573836.1 DNA-binding LacI/PurR family transcriptional regulator [Agromyces albus]
MTESKGSRRVSMTDVARRAGVSQSTVSYVLSGSRSISDRTRKAVERAIQELDFTPNAAAQALRGERSDTLVLSSPADDAYNDDTVGVYYLEVAAAARRAGCDLLLATDAADSGAALHRITASKRADAAILMSVIATDPRVRALERNGTPAIAMGDPTPFSSMPFVDYDFTADGRLAVDALVSWGHRSMVYVAFTDDELDEGLLYAERGIEGVRAAAERAGAHVHVMRSSRDVGEQARRLDALLDADPRPTALLCSYLSGFDRARGQFLARHPEVDPGRSVIALGTTGRSGGPGADSTRTVHSVRDIAETAVRMALLASTGKRSPSLKLVPDFEVLGA